MPFPSAKGLGMLVNTFWQNGDRKEGKGLSYFSCILFLLAGHPSLRWRLYFSEENYDSLNRTLEILHLLTWQSTVFCPQRRGVSSFLLNNLGFG